MLLAVSQADLVPAPPPHDQAHRQIDIKASEETIARLYAIADTLGAVLERALAALADILWRSIGYSAFQEQAVGLMRSPDRRAARVAWPI